MRHNSAGSESVVEEDFWLDLEYLAEGADRSRGCMLTGFYLMDPLAGFAFEPAGFPEHLRHFHLRPVSFFPQFPDAHSEELHNK